MSDVGRVPVAVLMGYESMDATEHSHTGMADRCFCAGSVVRKISEYSLHPAGRCPSCPWNAECSLPRLRAVASFTRPIFVKGRTVMNGHHRLAVAFERGEPSVLVSSDPDSQDCLVSADDVEWVASEIREATEPWQGPDGLELWELFEVVEHQLGYKITGGGADRAIRTLLAQQEAALT